MHADPARTLLAEIAAALDLPPGSVEHVRFTREDRLPSCFPVSDLAAAVMGAAGLAISDLLALREDMPAVEVDRRLASLWFGSSIQPQGWQMPGVWDDIAGDYRTHDGWIKLHTNAPHHRTAAVSVLDCEATRAAVADAVRHWKGSALEQAVVAAGGCAAVLRTHEEWSKHPQGVAVAQEALVI